MKIDVDKIVTRILKEAFTTGPYNTTPGSNGLSDKGGTTRQMLSGEWFGSPAWPFMQASSKDYAKAVELQQSQSVEGQGEHVGVGGVNESYLASILEDSPSSLLADTNSVEFLLNSIEEVGYTKESKEIALILENPTVDNIDRLISITESLEADKAPDFIVERLIDLTTFLVENESEDEGTDVEEPESDETTGEKV